MLGRYFVMMLFLVDILREQLLALLDTDAPSPAVVGQLVLVDTSHGEVVCFRMDDEESADGCRGLDGVVVVEGDIHLLLSIQQVEDDAFQRVVRTGGIAEGDS